MSFTHQNKPYPKNDSKSQSDHDSSFSPLSYLDDEPDDGILDEIDSVSEEEELENLVLTAKCADKTMIEDENTLSKLYDYDCVVLQTGSFIYLTFLDSSRCIAKQSSRSYYGCINGAGRERRHL